MNYSTSENAAGASTSGRQATSAQTDSQITSNSVGGIVMPAAPKTPGQMDSTTSARTDLKPGSMSDLRSEASSDAKSNSKYKSNSKSESKSVSVSVSKADARPNTRTDSKSDSKAASGPSLPDYTDFRVYLKDVYEFRRSTESTGVRSYSYSTFSAAADIRSPNYLKLIIEGRRNLSDDMITRFAKALRLPRVEVEEFRALVHYGQAVEPIERNKYLKDLSDRRAERAYKSGEINQASWDKVPGWIGWVLYAMADQGGVDFDPQNLHRLFRTKAAPEDIRESLEKLIASGELSRDAETGQVSKARDLIESPQDLPVPLIRKLQTELIYLGIESLFRDSPKEREFGAMTVAMTEEEFNQVRFELRQLRKRLQRDILVKRKVSKGERVYQLNVQLFPVTDKN